MRPLPDLGDVEAMAATGRRSALYSARKEAMEGLRDTFTKLQAVEIGDMQQLAGEACDWCARLQSISALWNEHDA